MTESKVIQVLYFDLNFPQSYYQSYFIVKLTQNDLLLQMLEVQTVSFPFHNHFPLERPHQLSDFSQHMMHIVVAEAATPNVLYVFFSLQFLPARYYGNCELRRVED